jgi:anti-sigma factor RsiW
MNSASQDREAGHARVLQMLPWYVNGTLEPRARQEVRDHLQHCHACRREIELHGVVRDQMRQSAQPPPASLASLDRLMARIDDYETARSRRWLRRLGGWLRGGVLERAVVVQATAIVMLVGVVAWLATRPEPPAEYRTLGAPTGWQETSGPYLQVELHDSLTAAQLQALLQQVNGRLVHGPSSSGVYRIRLEAGEGEPARSPAELAAWLSAQPGVVRAEPIGDGQP